MFYVLSLVGNECYSPVWFVSKYSKKAFKVAVKRAISSILKKFLTDPEVKEYPRYIDGHIFIGFMNPEVKDYLRNKMEAQGFIMIEPDYELEFEGECLYNYRNKKPPIFSKVDWEKILKNNEMVHNYVYDELKEEKE